MHRSPDCGLTEILSEITRVAGLPLEEAVGLPADAYRSDRLLELEIERVFRREWICIGRLDEIPDPGDWFSTDVAGEPLLAVRGADARVRVLANACRHRHAVIATGRGRAAHFQCPYHAWTYDLDGRLLGAPFMERTKGHDPGQCRLPELRSEAWGGFLYVNLDDEAPPLAPRLASLDAVLAHAGLAGARTLARGDESWDANWKVVIENAMESYHVFQVHPTTLDATFPTSRLEMREGGAGYNVHASPMREGAPAFPGIDAAALARHPQVAPDVARALWVSCIYPSHVVAVGLETVFWLVTHPQSIGRARVSWGVAQAGPVPDAGTPQGDAYRAAMRRGVEAVNAEDRQLVDAVQRGLASSRAAAGRLSHLERPIWEFIGYLARCLVPAA